VLEDLLLVRRLKRGSKDAFCRIYEKYWNDLLTLAANLLADPGAAEDVVQDVFTSFVRSAANFELRGNLKNFLATCVANRARDGLRKKKRQRAVPVNEAEPLVSTAKLPVQLLMRSEQLKQLSYAMTLLPYDQREAIVLRLHGGLKFKAIAESQNVSIKTVQSRYQYGLIKLRSILNGQVQK